MNRKVFMERLRECLADISAEEREDALTYYESYFEEAGVENEAQVIEELGSPEKVAENIKRDLLEEPQSSIQAPECMEKESSEDFSSEDFEKHEQYEEYEQKDKSGRIAMVIVIAVLTFPIWITVAATLFGLIVAAFGVLFGCAAGGIAATVGLLISGVALIGMGIGGKYCSGNPCDGSRIFRNGNRNPFIDLCCMDLWQGSSGMLPLDRQSL